MQRWVLSQLGLVMALSVPLLLNSIYAHGESGPMLPLYYRTQFL